MTLQTLEYGAAWQFAEVLDGRITRSLLLESSARGRGPQDFADYARDTAAARIWSGSPVAG
jgi:hypothetical protein